MSETVRPQAGTPIPYAVSAATLAGVGLLVLCEPAGPRFAALALAVGALVLTWGWPLLAGSASVRGSRVALAVAGLGMASVVAAAPNAAEALRAIPAVAAIALLCAFFGQLLRGEGRQGVVLSLIGDAAGIALLVSGATVVPLLLLRGGDRPIAAAMGGLAVSLLAQFIRIRWEQVRLVAAVLLGAVGGLGAGVTLASPAEAWVTAALGAVAALVAAAAQIPLRELPRGADPAYSAVVGCACVLAPGALVYTIGRLFL